jgi:hypothetical protein
LNRWLQISCYPVSPRAPSLCLTADHCRANGEHRNSTGRRRVCS